MILNQICFNLYSLIVEFFALQFEKRKFCGILFYALDFSLSVTVVVPEVVDVASVDGSAAHANDGNFANSAARYFG